MERFLAIQIKRIGDLILTVPALTRLKRERPNSRLTLVTLGPAGQLVPAIPAVDEHFNYRYRHPNLALWSRLINGRFDAALDFNGNDRAQLMTFLSRAELRAGYTKRAKGFFRERVYSHTSNASLKEFHTIDHMGALLDAIGLPPGENAERLTLQIPRATRSRVGEYLDRRGVEAGERYAVIHPGTAREEKYWLADRWAEVAEFLEDECGMRVVFTGGADPREQEHLRGIDSEGTCNPVDLAGELDLLQTAAVIEGADLVLGVDTAAMHLASTFEKPQVVLFAETSPWHWGPRHQRARIVLAGCSDPVRPANLDPVTQPKRMAEIGTEQVLAAIRSLR